MKKTLIIGLITMLSLCLTYGLAFGGVSGGGLWQVIIAKNEAGKVILKELILSGVAFYQTQNINNRRVIVCHGRRSVYKKVYDEVVTNLS